MLWVSMYNDFIFWFVVFTQSESSWDARECETIRDSLLVELKGLKVAKVLGIQESIGSGLESHKRPNCQGLLAEEIMFSTA
jgi:hypothetical protein